MIWYISFILFCMIEISILLHNACVITALCFLVFSWLSFSRFYPKKRNLKGRYFFLHCSIFKMLFSLSLLVRQLFYYITSSSLCQYLFESFFKKLFGVIAAPFRAALILYHYRNRLSSIFLKFLKKLFPKPKLQFCLSVFDSDIIISRQPVFVN